MTGKFNFQIAAFFHCLAKDCSIKEVKPPDEINLVPHPNDRDLLTGIANGAAPALRELYDRHSQRVYITALSYLQKATDADEVSQDVFTKVWRSAAGL